MRKAFNFYRSYYDVAKELSKKDREEFLMAILQKEFEGIEPNLEGMAKFAYLSQQHSIDKQVKGYEDKTKQKLTPTEGGCQGSTEGGTQGGSVQEKEKEEEKEELRTTKNKQPILEEVIAYFNENNYTTESATKAFNYYHPDWKDSNGRKVLNWKQKMRGVWFKDENLIKEEELTNDQILYRNVMAQVNKYK